MFYGKHKKDGSYGFFISKEDCENAFEISKEEWLSLIAAQKEGKEIIPNEDGSPFLREVIDTRTYAQKREVAYPSVNDYLDAYVK